VSEKVHFLGAIHALQPDMTANDNVDLSSETSLPDILDQDYLFASLDLDDDLDQDIGVRDCRLR